MTPHEKAVVAAAIACAEVPPIRNVDQARAAVTAYLTSMQEQGWVMVPREATDNMVDAARHFLEPQTERIGRSCYRAMLEAAKEE